MFRYLERGENSTRLLEAGQRISITHSLQDPSEWISIIDAIGAREAFNNKGYQYQLTDVINFMLRDKSNPSSILSTINLARENARMIRTALTREVWEAVNEAYLLLQKILSRHVTARALPSVLNQIRGQNYAISGALYGTMLRDDIYNFARIGTFIERAESTARLLDVKYFVLLPTVSHVGSSLDNAQWESILLSAAALKSYSWLFGGNTNPSAIANYLILDRRMPRSITFSFIELVSNLNLLADSYRATNPSHMIARDINKKLVRTDIDTIIQDGLHDFIQDFLQDSNTLGKQIEIDFRFYE